MSKDRMKGILVRDFGGPEVMQFTEMTVPVPQGTQVLVKVEAAGVNPVDTYIRSGQYPVLPPLPYTPGRDMAGTVLAAGSASGRWKTGDRVYAPVGTISGAYAEYALCSADQIYPLPERISFAQGAATGVPAYAAYRSLFIRGKAVAGETVLIHGASGAVGLAAVQLARSAGLTVFGTAGTEAGLRRVRDFGAHAVFHHGSSGYTEQIAAAAGKEASAGGLSLILEMRADINLETDLKLLGVGGRVIIVGSRGRIEIDPRLTMGAEKEIRGMALANATLAENRQTHAALFAGLEAGTLTPFIGTEMPLEDAARAHKIVAGDGDDSGRDYGKIILIP